MEEKKSTTKLLIVCEPLGLYMYRRWKLKKDRVRSGRLTIDDAHEERLEDYGENVQV
jgi:hypothetical protein